MGSQLLEEIRKIVQEETNKLRDELNELNRRMDKIEQQLGSLEKEVRSHSYRLDYLHNTIRVVETFGGNYSSANIAPSNAAAIFDEEEERPYFLKF